MTLHWAVRLHGTGRVGRHGARAVRRVAEYLEARTASARLSIGHIWENHAAELKELEIDHGESVLSEENPRLGWAREVQPPKVSAGDIGGVWVAHRRVGAGEVPEQIVRLLEELRWEYVSGGRDGACGIEAALNSACLLHCNLRPHHKRQL